MFVTEACNVVLHMANRVGTIIEIHHNGRRAVAPIYAMIRRLCQIRDRRAVLARLWERRHAARLLRPRRALAHPRVRRLSISAGSLV
jgi:hypothetical protein